MKILLVGDSLAVGLTNPLREIAAARGDDLISDATTGTTARQWVSAGRLGADVLAHDPDIVLVSLGTNDMKADQSNFANDVTALVDAAAGASVRWIGPPAMPFDAGIVRSTLTSVLGSRGVPVFPSDSRSYPRAADQIHMPPSGYAAWALDLSAAGYLDRQVPSSNKAKWIVTGAAALLVAWAAGWLD